MNRYGDDGQQGRGQPFDRGQCCPRRSDDRAVLLRHRPASGRDLGTASPTGRTAVDRNSAPASSGVGIDEHGLAVQLAEWVRIRAGEFRGEVDTRQHRLDTGQIDRIVRAGSALAEPLVLELKAIASGSEGRMHAVVQHPDLERRRTPSLSGYGVEGTRARAPTAPADGVSARRPAGRCRAWRPAHSGSSVSDGGFGRMMRPTLARRNTRRMRPYSAITCVIAFLLRRIDADDVGVFELERGATPAIWSYRTRSAATNHCDSGPYTASSSRLANARAMMRLRFCCFAVSKVSQVPCFRWKIIGKSLAA